MDVWKGELNSSSTYVPVYLTKDHFFHHIDTLTKIDVKIGKWRLPTFYWLTSKKEVPRDVRNSKGL